MIVTHKITMELTRGDILAAENVVQSDKYSRQLEITLLANAVPWNIPEDATILIRYRKPDSKGGEYDTLPDGTTAYSFNGNVVTVALAPQVCTVVGRVALTVAILQGTAEINTFVINLEVHENPGTNVAGSEDYYYNAALAARVTELEEDVADLQYKAIDVLSIANNVGTVELGTVVDAVTVSWSLNKDPVSQTVEGEAVAADARSVTLEGLGLTKDKSFTVTVTDEREATDDAVTSVRFLNGVYFGTLLEGATLDSAAILTLAKKLQSGKAVNFTVSSDRPVYALPTRYGTPTFKIGGFEYEWEKVATFDFTNNSGYTESYDVWMHSQDVSGSVTVNVT